ncbi:MAG: periplasmic heavy metal sensor [Alphaproteobacteria bacterium]|nr:periplasmic heavy metal sensor [Alphaproteobacteria bacterium]
MNSKTKWLLLILGLSMAINVFVLGMTLGREFKPVHGPMGGPRELAEFNLRRLASYLPEDQQSELRAILGKHRENLRGQFRAMREREEKIRALLFAETVDLEALEALLEAQEEGMNALKAPVRSIILDVVAKLDQETRQKLAMDLFERSKRPRRGPRGDRPGRHPPFGPEGPPPPEESVGTDGADDEL